MTTLLLVDGSSYLYRAFHALPDLRNRNGEPTGAVYGVLNMLRRLRRETPADYIACVFDAKGKTFRDEIYAQYKANRAAMPDDLSLQIEPLYACIRALGWPLLALEGVEADDVIGTLARQAAASGIQTVISTCDKDIAQLVDGSITLVNTMSNETLDETRVQVKFGVRPDQMVDFQALVGDSIDNIPGVDKVGPKTAAKWLAQYGSLDGILEHAAEIGGVVGENLRKVSDWLPTARRLVTIKTDVELPIGVDALAPLPPDRAELARLYERLEFKGWLRELKESAASEATVQGEAEASKTLAAAQPGRYETVLSEADLERWLEQIRRVSPVAINVSTTEAEPMRAAPVGIALCAVPGEAAYIPFGHRYAGAPEQLAEQAVLARLRPWLEDASYKKIGHDLKYDMHVLMNRGIRLAGVEHDTLLQSYVLEAHRPHDLEALAARHLAIRSSRYEELTGKGAARIGFDQVQLDQATAFSAQQADVALQLHRAMQPEITRDAGLTRVYRDIEMPVLPVLFAMERNGVRLDAAALEAQSAELGQRIVALERKVHELAGQPFNLGSPKQLQEILFERQKLPVIKKTPTGQPSTDEDVLEQLALDHPLPKLILEHRGLSKLKSTYTDKLPKMVHPETGRVHTTYGQAVAVTGRLSSNEPNLQNIPVRNVEGRRIREAFIAGSGRVIVSADYSQIELRIMAHLSKDANLVSAFSTGEDVHRHTASEVFGAAPDAVTSEQRRYAKVINFGLIYGMSAFGLATQLGIERAAAQQYMERYFARYPGVAEYMRSTRETARSRGYVETVFGRRLYLTDIRASNHARRQAAERAAINAPMQGTAADLIKLAMIAVQGWIEEQRLGSRLVMQVHDELVFEVPEAEWEQVRTRVPALMSQVAKLDVPLVVDIGAGSNWEKAH
jgi:DNA polymerase-1